MSELSTRIQSADPLIWMETFEEGRTLVASVQEVEALIKSGALVDENERPFKYRIMTWDCAVGIQEIGVKKGKLTTGQPITKAVNDGGQTLDLPTTNPVDPLIWLDAQPDKEQDGTTLGHIMFLKDFHDFFDKKIYAKTTEVIRWIRNILPKLKAQGKTLVVLSPLVSIPDEIEKEMHKVIIELPNRDGLRNILKALCKTNGVDYPSDDEVIIDAGLGLTGDEFESAVSASIVETEGSVEPQIITRQKAKTVEKAGLLEVIQTMESLETIGGNETLKSWVRRSMLLTGEGARAFGAKPPKGALLVGVPGCGKSLSCKAIATVSNRPLLRFDIGKVFDKYQGESEAKIRRCLAIAEAVAPCVLWIDELEKALSGTKGSDSDGHGTTKRVFSTFLNWLQERNADVFLVATANNVDTLPPELYRPGRIDAKFWLGLPDPSQRKEILEIHLKKKNREGIFTDEQLQQLVDASDKFSGAAIETWVQAAINYAFIEGNDEVTLQNFLDTVQDIGITDMSDENIVAAQKWAKKNRARMASLQAEETRKASTDRPQTEGARKLSLRLHKGDKPSVKRTSAEGTGTEG